MNRNLPVLAGVLLSVLTGCGGEDPGGPVTVSVVGVPASIVDPNRGPLANPSAILIGATAQGLVRFDASGQIEPGLAIRWDVSDDGLYYTFRLASDAGIDAEPAARQLRAVLARASRNPLKPLFGAVDEIVAVTPEVIEIRLASPQPDMLELLAQPEMAMLNGGAGTGPLAITMHEPRSLTLGPAVMQATDAVEEPGERQQTVQLRGERAALAVARFAAGKADLVLGGSFADLALARAARPPARQLRFDPAAGLFGLAVTHSTGFLASAENRRALALAIDRGRIAAAFPDTGWRVAETLVPIGMPGLPASRSAEGLALSPPLRFQIARGIVQLWKAQQGAPPPLRVAMPEGPGSRLVFTLLAIGWREIGVEAVAVPLHAPADLRLVDAVAPGDGAAWFLSRFSCTVSPVCNPQADAALASANRAPTITERDALLAEADRRLAEAIAFLPIGQPLRWSLVSPRLNGFVENTRGAHPLHHLIQPRR